MRRWLVLLLVAVTAGAGLGASLHRSAAEAGPLRLALPSVDEKSLIPGQMAVRPDGKAFALWHVVGGYGLAVWRTGDREAISLTDTALGELAWAPDGLFFAQMTAQQGGRPQILRYRWGGAAPEVVVEEDALRGKPRGLAWRPSGWLYFADDEGLKAVQPDAPQTLNRLKGPGLPDTLQYGAFAPGGLQYVAVQEGRLVLAVAGRDEAVTLLESIGSGLTRVTWSRDGRRVAVGLGQGNLGGQVLVMDLAGGGSPRLSGRVEGGSPLFVGERLLYLAPAGQVMEWREQGSVLVAEGPAAGLAGSASSRYFYLIQQAAQPAVLQVPLP